MTAVALNALLRPLIEPGLPDWVEPRWFTSAEDLLATAGEVEIGWFDTYVQLDLADAALRGNKLKWINTLSAGVDHYPLELMRERGIVFTNGAGLNAIPIAEFALMGMLTLAKNYREISRAQDRHEWLTDAPGKKELHGTRALILGAGGIGGRIGELLRPFGVEVTEVRRRPSPAGGSRRALRPDEWRGRLGEFDWVIVAVPSTPDTAEMIGAAELAAMKPDASILNFARGAVIDQSALVEALTARRIAAAFLDVTDPEPLPADHPLWSLDNCHISMHLSGRAQNTLFRRAAERFIENLGHWQRGEPLVSVVDLGTGY